MAITLCKFRYKDVDLHVIIEDHRVWYRFVDVMEMFRPPEGHMNKMFFTIDYKTFKRGASEYVYMSEIAFLILMRSMYSKIEMGPFEAWFQSQCLPEIRHTMQAVHFHNVGKSDLKNLTGKLRRLEAKFSNLDAQFIKLDSQFNEANDYLEEASDNLKSVFGLNSVQWTSTGGEDVESCNPIERLKKNQDDGEDQSEDGEDEDGDEDQPEEEDEK